jgi:hypothetical protein
MTITCFIPNADRLRRALRKLIVLPTVFVFAASVARAQVKSPSITPDSLKLHLYRIAADSMMGRQPGSEGDFKAAEYVAARFKAAGLEPAGDNGTWFQVVPFVQQRVDLNGVMQAGPHTLHAGADFLPFRGFPARAWDFAATPTIYGGDALDSATWIPAAQAKGKVVVLSVGRVGGPRSYVPAFAVVPNPRWRDAAAVMIAELDILSPDRRAAQMEGGVRVDLQEPVTTPAPFWITPSAADSIFGSDITRMAPGKEGVPLSHTGSLLRTPVPYPARNVVGILRGSDPTLRGEYVALTAHNDHVGFNHSPVDHDSLRAHNEVVRHMGADSPERAETPAESIKVHHILDSLRAIRPPRADSIRNGADDDGSGTVSLIVLAQALSKARPRRSILFVSHTGEEYGLVGSEWFTDHPRVPIDSIVADIDEDMIGRGSATDVDGGGPTYLEVVGAKRVSVEFGEQLEKANAAQATPFVFNYTFDAPGHPLQYYCRADHYSYARYGIPAAALSTGEHLDYHQVTDEPQYIDYVNMARVTQLVYDAALLIANADRRPALNGPKGDPHAVCKQ